MSAAAWIARGERSLETASLLLDIDPDGAANRAYYAMYYAARAALLTVGQVRRAEGKTHAGLISAFGEHLVKPGLIPAEHGRALAQVADLRLAADYDVVETPGVAVIEVVARADAFVTAVKDWMMEKSE